MIELSSKSCYPVLKIVNEFRDEDSSGHGN